MSCGFISIMKQNWCIVCSLIIFSISGCDGSKYLKPTIIFPSERGSIPGNYASNLIKTLTPTPKVVPDPEHIVDEQANQVIKQASLVGLTIGILQGDQDPFISGYGYANKEYLIPAGVDTVYMIGSVSKQFTAATVMHLVEQGALNLDEPISLYLKGIPSRWENVTIRQLLTHTGGIPNYATDAMGFDLEQAYTPDELMEKFTQWNLLNFEPGTRWEYSNRGYFLLGMIIKQITGQDYHDYLIANLLEPLGIHRIKACIRVTQDLAKGYRIARWGGEPEEADPINPSFAYGAGDLCSTAGDLLQWQEALATGMIVSEESYKLMTAPVELPDGTMTGYGFGLEIADKNSLPTIFHAGGIPTGFITLSVYYPSEHYGIVLLTNTMTPVYNPLEKLESSIAEELLSIP